MVWWVLVFSRRVCGKTFILFKCLNKLPKGTDVLFIAEVSIRWKTILEDAEFYKQCYGYDPLEGYNIKHCLYQSAWKHDIQYYFPNSRSTFIICDEWHEAGSDKRILFFKNSKLDGVKVLCLTATLDKKTKYLVQGEEITKTDLLSRYAPVIFTYTLNNAMEDKNTRELKFFILKNDLDLRRNMETGTKFQRWTTSESLQYQYLDREFKKSLFIPTSVENRDFRIRMCASNRARFMYSLKSKTELVKELISKLDGKTLVFGQDNKTLLDICPTSIVQDNKNLLKDLEDFKKGRTQLTCSNRILKQGENVPDLKNVIFHSYFSKETAILQRSTEDCANLWKQVI